MAQEAYELLFLLQKRMDMGSGAEPCHEELMRCAWMLWQNGERREAVALLMQVLVSYKNQAAFFLCLELLLYEGMTDKASQFCDWLKAWDQEETKACLAMLRLYCGDFTQWEQDVAQRSAYERFATQAQAQAKEMGLMPPPQCILPLVDGALRLFLGKNNSCADGKLDAMLRSIEEEAGLHGPDADWTNLCSRAHRRHPAAGAHALYFASLHASNEKEAGERIGHLEAEAQRLGLCHYKAAAAGLASLLAARVGEGSRADSLKAQCLGYFRKQGIAQPEELIALAPQEMQKPPKPAVEKKLQISCFGGFSVVAHGERVRFRTRRALEMMAYFVHHVGRMIPRDELLLEFWPERPPQKAGTLLHTNLYNMRKALEAVGCEDCIIHDDHCYGIDLARVDCDLVEFSRFLANAKEMSPMEILVSMEPLSLYTGQYMNNIDGSWYLSTQIRIEQQVTEIRRRLGDYLMGRGAYQEALIHLIAASQIDPFNESFHEQIILCYMKLGNRVAALRQYELMCRQLREELSESPQDSIRQRMKELLGADSIEGGI